MSNAERELLLAVATCLDELAHIAELYLVDATLPGDLTADGIIAAKQIQQVLEDGINQVRREDAAWERAQ